jgi:hypothetical protein
MKPNKWGCVAVHTTVLLFAGCRTEEQNAENQLFRVYRREPKRGKAVPGFGIQLLLVTEWDMFVHYFG